MNTPALLKAAQEAANSDQSELLKRLLQFFTELRRMDKNELLDAYNSMEFVMSFSPPDSSVYKQAAAIRDGIRRIVNSKDGKSIREMYQRILG